MYYTLNADLMEEQTDMLAALFHYFMCKCDNFILSSASVANFPPLHSVLCCRL